MNFYKKNIDQGNKKRGERDPSNNCREVANEEVEEKKEFKERFMEIFEKGQDELVGTFIYDDSSLSSFLFLLFEDVVKITIGSDIEGFFPPFVKKIVDDFMQEGSFFSENAFAEIVRSFIRHFDYLAYLGCHANFLGMMWEIVYEPIDLIDGEFLIFLSKTIREDPSIVAPDIVTSVLLRCTDKMTGLNEIKFETLLGESFERVVNDQPKKIRQDLYDTLKTGFRGEGDEDVYENFCKCFILLESCLYLIDNIKDKNISIFDDSIIGFLNTIMESKIGGINNFLLIHLLDISFSYFQLGEKVVSNSLLKIYNLIGELFVVIGERDLVVDEMEMLTRCFDLYATIIIGGRDGFCEQICQLFLLIVRNGLDAIDFRCRERVYNFITESLEDEELRYDIIERVFGEDGFEDFVALLADCSNFDSTRLNSIVYVCLSECLDMSDLGDVRSEYIMRAIDDLIDEFAECPMEGEVMSSYELFMERFQGRDHCKRARAGGET